MKKPKEEIEPKPQEAKVDGNGDKPTENQPEGLVKRTTFMPPASSPMVRQQDPSKERIATKIIEATGVKLQELNLIPRGMFIQLVLLDVYQYIQANPNANGGDISYFLQQSIYHHLRGVSAGLLNKVVMLANEEYKVSQQGNDGSGLPGMLG